jgi:hypothetical protein
MNSAALSSLPTILQTNNNVHREILARLVRQKIPLVVCYTDSAVRHVANHWYQYPDSFHNALMAYPNKGLRLSRASDQEK